MKPKAPKKNITPKNESELTAQLNDIRFSRMVFPGIAAISILAFISGWSEYLFVYTFLRSSGSWTLTSYIVGALGELGVADYGLLAAGSTFYMLPVLLFFLFTQKYLMRVSVGGMKGGA